MSVYMGKGPRFDGGLWFVTVILVSLATLVLLP